MHAPRIQTLRVIYNEFSKLAKNCSLFSLQVVSYQNDSTISHDH